MGDKIDKIDATILALVEADSKTSLRRIGRIVGLTAPSVGERLRKLEDQGAIIGYGVTIDPAKIGRPIHALIRLSPRPGSLGQVEQTLIDEPMVIHYFKITGEDCFLAEVAVADMAALDQLASRFEANSTTNSALVKKSSRAACFHAPALVPSNSVD